MAINNLAALSRSGSAPATLVSPPRSRFATRVLLPALIALAALALLAYAARESLRPSTPVVTAPVVLKIGVSGSTNARSSEIVQAPGWIEADPFAVSVPALAPGVLKEIAVLEDERVEKDQVIARLVDDDAVLERKRAETE